MSALMDALRRPLRLQHEIRLRPARSADEWDALASRFPGRTEFHSWRFLHEEARVGGWRIETLVAERHGEPIGLVPLTVSGRLLRHTAEVPHPYHGPIAASGEMLDLLRTLRRVRRQRLMTRLWVSFTPDHEDAAATLEAAGWRARVDRTYVVSLSEGSDAASDPAAVLPFVRPRRRNRMRRALRLGVRADRVHQVDELLLEVMTHAYSAHGARFAQPPATIEWVNRVLARGDAIAVEASLDGRRLGVLIGLRSGSTMLGWLGAASLEGRTVDAGTLLYHELLRLAASEGVQLYDMLGHVDTGVADFKLSMGAGMQEFVEGHDVALFLTLARRIRDAIRRQARKIRPAPAVRSD